MRRHMLKSKIHRATVTEAELHYVGSITIDADLMRLADLREYEKVQVVDIDNGARLETYVIVGGPGQICMNGAAARLVHPGDRIIVMAYAEVDEEELAGFKPAIVLVNERNQPVGHPDLHVAR